MFNHHPLPVRELDPALYYITESEARLLKEYTGITDDNELKHHILKVQAEAYALPENSAYPALLKLGKTRENAILLDIGCGFGNDSRRAIADGFPLQNVLCTDLREGANHNYEPTLGFFNIGHKLFKTAPESFPLAFFRGDIFDTVFTYPQPMTIPKLSALDNLGQLKGQISIIHASAFFHLFGEEGQRKLAQILGQLLSPQPGSIILGCQIGAPARIFSTRIFSPDTWKDIWTGDDGPFNPDIVEVHAYPRPLDGDEMRASTGPSADGERFWLTWSVLRK
ncbi:hypothetical protein Clacol_007988 [Clathrus columnatus]|uniref:Methyltransferase domain-containing protein n=1 Tax=Clathrus columnatus TaxID=1419009 RepID=A0AAV5AIZ8_9AGAM|nr:hypothetical protein Clacol_007988 [Clathrus columnatus]